MPDPASGPPYRLTCANCRVTKVVATTHYQGQPILQWWRRQGELCTTCHQAHQAAVFAERDGRVHADGHDTEYEAAASVREITGRLRQQALELLRAHPEGLTDDEGGALMGGDRLTFGRRRQELVTEGFVVKTSARRLTPRGRNAIVWKAREHDR